MPLSLEERPDILCAADHKFSGRQDSWANAALVRHPVCRLADVEKDRLVTPIVPAMSRVKQRVSLTPSEVVPNEHQPWEELAVLRTPHDVENLSTVASFLM